MMFYVPNCQAKIETHPPTRTLRDMSLSVQMNFQKQTHPIHENYCSGIWRPNIKYYYNGGLIYEKFLVSNSLLNNTLRVKKTCFLESSIKNTLNVKRIK